MNFKVLKSIVSTKIRRFILVGFFFHVHSLIAADGDLNKRLPLHFPKSDILAGFCFDALEFLGSKSLDPFSHPETVRQTIVFPDSPHRNFDEVRAAFSPVAGSEGQKFLDLSLMNSESQSLWDRIPQRKNESDMMAAQLVKNRIQEYKNLGALVIVDSGHAHSIAIGVTLAEAGYQPIVKMGNLRGAKDKDFQLQPIGAMKYYADRMEAAKKNLRPNSPLAIVMDAHRNSTGFLTRPPTSYDYPPDGFPSVAEIKEKYKGRVVRITEGVERGIVKRDDYTPPFLQHYRDAGIEIYQHFADPYHNKTPWYAISLILGK